MKALSIQQPWAELIVSGKKSVENRSWRTWYRGPLIIHASKKHDWEAGEWLLSEGIEVDQACAHGAIIGICELVDCVRHEDMPCMFPAAQLAFAFGPWCWILRNPKRTPVISYMGHLGIFDINEPHILEQLPK